MGSVEVAESRGITLCEGALQLLRVCCLLFVGICFFACLAEIQQIFKARKQTTNAILCVSGDGIRVADQSGRQLIVDQNIERVSFCSPVLYSYAVCISLLALYLYNRTVTTARDLLTFVGTGQQSAGCAMAFRLLTNRFIF